VRRLLVGVTLALAPACASDEVAFVDASVRAVEVRGGAAFVVVPDSPGPHPLALYTHGLRAPEDGLLHHRHAFVQGLVDEGFAVAAAYADGPAWGSSASQAAYRELNELVAAEHEIGDVVVVSESMGGVAGLNLVADGAVPALAWVGISPVTNLPAMAAVEALADSIAAALSPDDVKALDPMGLDLGDVPLVVYVDPDDPVVPTADNGAALRGAEVRPCTGGHVAAACFRPAEIAALLHDLGRG
jgi:hypothetical protein